MGLQKLTTHNLHWTHFQLESVTYSIVFVGWIINVNIYLLIINLTMHHDMLLVFLAYYSTACWHTLPLGITTLKYTI